MREIKFRGSREDGKGWIYGHYFEQPLRYGHHSSIYVEDGDEEQSHTGWVHVKRESVGQFTGLKDKNGKEIYEGDKLKIWNFYHQSGTTADWFGAEPHNSQPVYEEYLETMYATVEFKNGSFIAKNTNHEIPLSAVIKGLGNEVASFYLCDYGGSLDDFLECLYDVGDEKHYDELKRLEGEELYNRLEQIVNELTQQVEIIGNIHENPELLK